MFETNRVKFYLQNEVSELRGQDGKVQKQFRSEFSEYFTLRSCLLTVICEMALYCKQGLDKQKVFGGCEALNGASRFTQ